MSALPTSTYANKNLPYFMLYNNDLVISTITANEAIVLDTPDQAIWGVAGGANSSIIQTQSVPTSTLNVISIRQNDQNASSIQALTIGQNDGDGANSYLVHTNGGVNTGQISFLSSINGQGGGIELQSQSGFQMNVATGAVNMIGESDGALTFLIQDSSNAYIQHKPEPFTVTSQIHFNQANSSITLVSETGQSLGVNVAGIGMNPGAGFPVVLQSGYFDMSNSGMSNVSSINGTPLPTAVKGYPLIPGSNPFVFASNAANFTVATFSNLTPNAIYRCGFSAAFECLTNVTPNADAYFRISGFGSGSPNDAESIGSVNANSIEQFNNSGGTLGAANAFYGCMFSPSTASWDILINAGSNLNTDVSMFMGPLYLEKLL